MKPAPPLASMSRLDSTSSLNSHASTWPSGRPIETKRAGKRHFDLNPTSLTNHQCQAQAAIALEDGRIPLHFLEQQEQPWPSLELDGIGTRRGQTAPQKMKPQPRHRRRPRRPRLRNRRYVEQVAAYSDDDASSLLALTHSVQHYLYWYQAPCHQHHYPSYTITS